MLNVNANAGDLAPQAIGILKDLCSKNALIVLSLKRRKTPGPSRRANKRLSVGRPTY